MVEEAQALLVDLLHASQELEGSRASLESSLQPSQQTTTSDRVSRLLNRTEAALKDVQTKDKAFQVHIAQALRESSLAFKAKKLKSDYERRLQIGPITKQCQVTLKRARLVLAELRKKELTEMRNTERRSHRPSTTHLAPGDVVVQHEGQQQYILREYDDQKTREMEQEELRAIARNANIVKELASDVGSLLEVQQDDIDKLEDNTADAVTRTIDGVHELSRYRKRQAGSGATKAGFGTAAVGGLVGILGGPVGIAIGAAAGGFVGVVAGKGVAAVKKRSINAETRRVKALLAVRKKHSGEYTLEVSAYQIEKWSYVQRAWMTEPSMWVDEFGDTVQGAHPGNEMSPLEARLVILACARSGASQISSEIEDEVATIQEREVKENVVWEWATNKWTKVVDRPNTDLAGWDYASSASSDTWFPEAKRGCVVRRLLWVRTLVGKPGHSNASLPSSAQKNHLVRTAWKVKRPDTELNETDQLWQGIYSSTEQTSSIMSESLHRVSLQGEQISGSERNAVVVGDAAVYSERINRAAYLSGALKNMMTWSKGQLNDTERYAKDLEARRKMKEEEDSKWAQSTGWNPDEEIDVSEATSRTLQYNKRIASRMADELLVQNDQLERTASAVERGNQGMLKITKSIK